MYYAYRYVKAIVGSETKFKWLKLMCSLNLLTKIVEAKENGNK